MDNHMRHFSGARLRAARRAAGLSTKDLARAIGREPSTINDYERGRTCPSAAHVGTFAAALATPVDALYTDGPTEPDGAPQSMVVVPPVTSPDQLRWLAEKVMEEAAARGFWTHPGTTQQPEPPKVRKRPPADVSGLMPVGQTAVYRLGMKTLTRDILAREVRDMGHPISHDAAQALLAALKAEHGNGETRTAA